MRKKRNLSFLIVGLIELAAIAYLVLNISPDKNLSLFNIAISSVFTLFVLLSSSLFFLVSFILNDQRQGFLISFFATLYLILRLNRLTHPLFLILIIAIFVTLELLFKKRK